LGECFTQCSRTQATSAACSLSLRRPASSPPIDHSTTRPLDFTSFSAITLP